MISFWLNAFCFNTLGYAQWEADKRLTVYPNYYDYGSVNNAWTIAVRDSIVHVVWEDTRDGNEEIYYKRHKCEPPGVEESEVLNSRLEDLKITRFSWYNSKRGIYFFRFKIEGFEGLNKAIIFNHMREKQLMII